MDGEQSAPKPLTSEDDYELDYEDELEWCLQKSNSHMYV